MGRSSKDKGDRGEREAAAVLSDLLGPVERIYGAGRQGDRGDLALDPRLSCAVQVAAWDDVRAAAVRKVDEVREQAMRGRCRYGVAMVRFRGGKWRIVMTPETFAELLREATA